MRDRLRIEVSPLRAAWTAWAAWAEAPGSLPAGEQMPATSSVECRANLATAAEDDEREEDAEEEVGAPAMGVLPQTRWWLSQ